MGWLGWSLVVVELLRSSRNGTMAKSVLANAALLAHPFPSAEYALTTDACSMTMLGSCLVVNKVGEKKLELLCRLYLHPTRLRFHLQLSFINKNTFRSHLSLTILPWSFSKKSFRYEGKTSAQSSCTPRGPGHLGRKACSLSDAGFFSVFSLLWSHYADYDFLIIYKCTKKIFITLFITDRICPYH